MTGFEIYDREIEKGGDYAQALRTMFLNIGEKLFPLLEDAEKEGKKLEIDETNLPDEWDGFQVENVKLV